MSAQKKQITTESDFVQAELETRQALAVQPKERIYIPSDRPLWEGSINGHILLIKTNQYVEVPRDVARLIANNTLVIKDTEQLVKSFKGSGKSSPNIEVPPMGRPAERMKAHDIERYNNFCSCAA